MTREARKLTADLHLFFYSSKSNPPISYLTLQQTFYCDFPSFSAYLSRGVTKKVLVQHSESFPFVNLSHDVQSFLILKSQVQIMRNIFYLEAPVPIFIIKNEEFPIGNTKSPHSSKNCGGNRNQ